MPAFSSRASRRGLVALSMLLGVGSLSLVASPSQADDSSTLTVVGTSDVYDSNLVQSVLKPGFEAAYPKYTLNYVSKGTGAAIDYAEAGTASALIVHAASLENQFVASGYSNEKFGRAIFYGDYVLLGPSADPAGVMTSDPNNIVGAFEKIAAAGANGTADFVSRGGTPGTTVQEHKIWSLSTGVTTCSVSSANGGGTSPSTTTGACPDPITYPSWYHATGLTQGPNLVNADACNYGHGNDCYVLTDRGTYDYLVSTHAISNLTIVTRANAAAAPGGANLLVNSFHAYAVNPAKFTGTARAGINVTAATAFLNWVTSPAAQRAVGNYLRTSTYGAPFLPDAAPHVTAYGPAARVRGGRAIRVHGTISNQAPGTQRLGGITVRLRGTPTSGARKTTYLAVAKTNAAGAYVLRYRPTRNRTYAVVVPTFSKVEDASLSPVFGDLLTRTTKALGSTHVVGAVRVSRIRARGGAVTFTGRVVPGAVGRRAHLSLYGAPAGGGRLHFLASRRIPNGHAAFSARFPLSHRTWKLQLRYSNVGTILGGSTASHRVRVH